MTKQSIPARPTAFAADESVLSTIAEGLAGHRILLYGFGVIIAMSATCQILRTDLALYLWIVLAIYLVGSLLWLITGEQFPPPRAQPTGSTTIVSIEGSEHVRDIANATDCGAHTEVEIRDAKNISGIANGAGRPGEPDGGRST